MLINAIQQEELRVAIIKGNRLFDLDIESIGQEQKKANIYKGRVTRIEPSLDAAFIDFGAEKHGFLPLKEVSRNYFQSYSNNSNNAEGASAISGSGNQSSAAKDLLLKENQEIIVQVDKEERGTKGAALTTFISLAGSYLVLMPNNPRAGGISRRIEGSEREEMRDILSKLVIPDDMGVIVRTAGVDKSLAELQWDLDCLLKHWDAIKVASNEKPAPFLIHRESDIVIRCVRDYLREDISEILVDTPKIYEKIKNYIEQFRPDFADRIKLYQDKKSLFSRFQIEKQIETAYKHSVNLPSGGAIVIDPTEALVSIDVNSARATGGRDIEETALNTNLEAADEIARQLRLRDIGGLIVIDFIDMTPMQNQRAVADRLREALKADRARVRIGNITKFGLMEMSRQRIRPPLGEAWQETCPRCEGLGTIRSLSSLALSIIRLIEEEATVEKIGQIQAHLPVELATFLLNEKRSSITEIENRYGVRVLVIPNPYIKTPKYKIKSLQANQLRVESYKLIEMPRINPVATEEIAAIRPEEEPMVRMVHSQYPAQKIGFFAKLAKLFKTEKPAAVDKSNSKEVQQPAEVATRTSTNENYKKYYQNRTRRGNRGGRRRYPQRNPKQQSQNQSQSQSQNGG